MKRILATAAVLGLLAGSSAYADDGCSVPKAEWQPEQALRQKLEGAGWKINRVKVDDGCYEVYARMRRDSAPRPTSIRSRSSRSTPGTMGDAMATTRVWDLFVRIFHWSLAASFAVAWISGDDWKSLHIWAGYAAAALIAMRLLGA
ncbi:MAG: PepSY domain-containing protein [Methyloceanibacter sp.]